MGYEKKIQLAVRAGLELGVSEFQVRRSRALNYGLREKNPASGQSGT